MNVIENSTKNDIIVSESFEPFQEKETVITNNGVRKKITISICPQCGNQINKYICKNNCKYCGVELKWPSKNKKEGM